MPSFSVRPLSYSLGAEIMGVDLAGGGSAAFARFILAERNRYQEIVRTAGITVD
jgi:hypothetical protein